MSYLLLRLGVFHTPSTRKVRGTIQHCIQIPKREAIKIHPYYVQDRFFNSNDVVPMTSSLLKELLEGTKPFELEREGIPTAAYYVDQNMTPQTMQRVAAQLGTQRLQSFATALEHIYCDEIRSVGIEIGETDVYDITVPTTHNFVGGNSPMILHNTVAQQQLAKWSDAEIIVYVGCGERGNEMTEVLTEFPELKDPRNGAPLMNRTVLIANTSNMPVAAREASIYTGITIAEYFRDMGYDVAMMADSTSRWAEALREISSRLEEMPGEEGYPAYLASRLAEFYERAALVRPLCASEKTASLSIIGAVSPPGGDFFEPVTQSSLRVAKAFWALDAKIAQRRHFPSINWLEGYTLYQQLLEDWYVKNMSPDWGARVETMSRLLQEEAQLLEIVQLVGSDALPDAQQLTLQTARLIREGLLQQSAYDPLESYCPLRKSYLLMRLMAIYHEQGTAAVNRGARFAQIEEFKLNEKIYRFKFSKEFEQEAVALEQEIKEKISAVNA
jgi:V/A-type H+-transporting ATPase subunit A